MERSIRKPDGQITALLEALFLFRPIPYPILRLRVLVLASLRILHGWRLRGRGLPVTWKLDQEPCTKATKPGSIGQPSLTLKSDSEAGQ